MSTTNTCPRCGTSLPKEGEPCPRCLLELGRTPREPAPPPISGAASGSAPRARRRADPTVEELAKRFPDLEIASRIGAGGMGAVYKARQPRIDRWVALKVLSLDPVDDPTFAERFRREAIALARLDHPNVVKLYDFGERDGLFFLLLEHVDGPNLRTLMKQGLLAPAQALAIVPQICEALQFAHDEGIVHRDIKPENVLLDAKGRVKIADFGLAKLVDADARDVSLTEVDQIVGTPHYMAPEQLRGSREVDHRADIYSLGVVFYEMLTGELPRGNFELPSKRVQVHVKLDEIVLKSLERTPERRYQHAVEVKTDVESVGSEAPPSEESSDIGILIESIVGKETNYSKVTIHPSKPWEYSITFLVLWFVAGIAWNGGGLWLTGALALVGATFWSQIDHAIRRKPELEAALKAESSGKRSLRHAAALVLVVGGLVALFAGQVALFPKLSPGYRASLSDAESVRAVIWDLPSTIDDPLRERLRLSWGSQTTKEVGIWKLDHEKIWKTPVLVPIALLLLSAAACALMAKRGRPAIASAIAASGTLFLPLVLLQGLGFVVAARSTTGGRLIPILDPDLSSPEQAVADRGTEEASQRLRVALLRRGYQVVEQGTWSQADPGLPRSSAEIQMLLAEPASPFDRWKLGWSGPRRREPQGVFVLTGSHDEGPVRIHCILGNVQVDSPLRKEYRTWTRGLLDELGEK